VPSSGKITNHFGEVCLPFHTTPPQVSLLAGQKIN